MQAYRTTSTSPAHPGSAHAGALRPADAYIRESQHLQSEYSPEIQLAAIKEMMLKQGYYCANVEHDDERGRITTRKGYKRIEERARSGLTEAVFVYMLARWGRDAAERLRMGRELDRLRVPLFSVAEGRDEPGLKRGMHAIIDEEFSRNLSYKMVRAMPMAAKDGKYLARTPIGYKRIFPADQPYRRKAAAEMVEDETYGPLVRDVYRWYVVGQSARAIARRLNTMRAEYPNPQHKEGTWSYGTVLGILSKRVYIGEIEWGIRREGAYYQYEGPVLRSGTLDCKPARHPAIVDRDLWEAAQRRLEGERREQRTTERGNALALLTGFLRCERCGALCTPRKHSRRKEAAGQYFCIERITGRGACDGPSISMTVAEQAVLRELARLQKRPWTPEAIEQVAREDVHAGGRHRLRADIVGAEAELQKSVAVFRAVGDISDEAITAFRADQQALSERIRAARDQLAALPRTSVDCDVLKGVYDQLPTTDMAGLIDRLCAAGETLTLRELLRLTVKSARITERLASGLAGRAAWARAAADWTDEVALLVRAGLLTFGPQPQPPVLPSAQERARERCRRYRARKKEGRIGR